MPVEKDYFVDAIESLLPGAKMHASTGGEKADSEQNFIIDWLDESCLLYTSPSPRDRG